MDPKNTSALDPKLKEIYDRVMGTNLPPTPQAPQSLKPEVSPAVAPTQQSNTPVKPTVSAFQTLAPQTPPIPQPPKFASPQVITPVPPPPASPSIMNKPVTTGPMPQLGFPQTPSQPPKPIVPPTPQPLQPVQQRPSIPPPLNQMAAPMMPPQMGTMPVNKPLSAPSMGIKQKKGVPFVVWLSGAFVFILIWTFSWIKVFNYKLPFLP